MSLVVKRLVWDSRFFGVSCGEVSVVGSWKLAGLKDRVQLLEKVLDEADFGFTVLRVDAGDLLTVQAAESLGFFVVDVHTCYVLDKRDRCLPVVPREFEVKCHVVECPVVDKRLVGLARRVFSHGFGHRFHNDPHICKVKADRLYVLLTLQCLKRHSRVVIVEEYGVPVAFLSLQEHVGVVDGVSVGRFGMAGVAPEARGKGVYQNMILFGLHLLQDPVVETSNTNVTNPVVRAWMNLGFKPLYTRFSLHRWNLPVDLEALGHCSLD